MSGENELLVKRLSEWLGEEGKAFFKENMEKHGTYIPVLEGEKLQNGSTIPHPVHLREGMKVRNFLRSGASTYGLTIFDGVELDDVYVGYIEKAMEFVEEDKDANESD